MVKKFLYFIAFCIVIFIVGRIVYEMFADELAELAFVPSGAFTPTTPMDANAYQDPALWYSRPGIGTNDPARWQPAFAADSNADADSESSAIVGNGNVPEFAVFFVHPTSYLNRANWNAPLGDEEAERVARLYVRGMASPFNAASEIWAPRYRQATMGAFLTDAPEGEQAIDAAYGDVLDAYRYFLGSIDDDTPIVLVGHSQGSLHLTRLLREEIKDGPVADRLVAAYAVGWPISVEHDLQDLGFPACATSSQTGCILSWSSFAEPADPSSFMDAYSESIGFDGEPRGDSAILCTNPLTGAFGGGAPASANRGTLVPDAAISTGELVPAAVPARCDTSGLLLVGDPPDLGPYVLPGNNYHVYDIPLFWANTKIDVARRVNAFAG